MHNKRGQITIFIIIGIVIVAAIVILAATRRLPFTTPSQAAEKINVDECIQESINNALDIILPQGGSLNPPLYQDYDGRKVAFLCYTNVFYSPCTTQVPFLGEGIKKGLEEYAGSRIQDCFYALEQDYQRRGYVVESGPLNFSIDILPNRLGININKELIFSKGEERVVYNEFRVNKASALFGMLMAVHDTIDQESRFCNFEYIGYMLVHPEFSIEMNMLGTEVKIYSIESRKTGEEITFATRSCALPPNGI